MWLIKRTESSYSALAQSWSRVGEERGGRLERRVLEVGKLAHGGLEAGENVGEEIQRVDEKF